MQTMTIRPEGETGRRLKAVTNQWILPAPYANPAMLEMFRWRDRQPYAKQVPWAGEFAGKYLTHAVQILRLTGDPRLREHLKWFVGELVKCQADDGYLGPWPKDWRLKRGCPTCEEPWDAWGHYHIMVGLMLWHELTADAAAFRCVRRMGDLFCSRFMEGSERLHGTGAHEMNQAPIHSLAMLHRKTGEPRYLAMAMRILEEFEMPPAGNYYKAGLAGQDFKDTPKPRWESLHPIMGLAELYRVTGDASYRKAFEFLWWSMLKGDRHNNGGFTSGEKATGNPYDPGPIETCCTVAWMAMSVEMLKISGLSQVADELELSLFNSGFGMMSPSGRWVTYNTPMDGIREASAHTIVFQARAGSPELNCCSVNGPRALGLVSDWAMVETPDGWRINYYGPGTMSAGVDGKRVFAIKQDTEYPFGPVINFTIEAAPATEKTLGLRIPCWSEQTILTVNRKPVPVPEPGCYVDIHRKWRKGDRIRLELDFRPHFWVEKPFVAGDKPEVPNGPFGGDVFRTSVYRGPILLSFDPRFNSMDVRELPALDAGTMSKARKARAGSWLEPLLLLAYKAGGGREVRLCDFASAGWGGNPMLSWLPVRFDKVPVAEFSGANPLRSFRV